MPMTQPAVNGFLKVELLFKAQSKKPGYPKRLLLLLLPVFIFCLTAQSQSSVLSGRLKDIHGHPLAGVSITKKSAADTSVKRLSDSSGAYSIPVATGEVLLFSAPGHNPQEIRVSGKRLNKQLDLMLAEGTKDAIANRLYDVIPQSQSVAASSSVYTKDLKTTPTADFSNALSGRLAGLFLTQLSGAPGNDGAEAQLRGQRPIVMFNGIARDYSSIDPEEIESVTVLKDAVGTGMLGLRGSNGVLLVKTKSGEIGKQVISVTAQSGIQTTVKLPQALSAFDYATLYNEALANDGRPPVYTQAALDAYKNGTDPIAFPNVDWYKTLLNKNARFSRLNANTSGGGNSARYFVGVDYLTQEGLYKEDAINTYNTNVDYKRYLIRSNIDLNIAKNLLLNLNLFGRIEDRTVPGAAFDVFSGIASTPNNAYPVFNANGSLGGNTTFQNNLWGRTTRSGYNLLYNRDISADVSLKRLLDKVTKGLWIKGLASFNSSLFAVTQRTKSFAVYQQTTNAQGQPVYTKFGTDGVLGQTGTFNVPSRNLYTELSAGYSRSFGHHAVQGLAMANLQEIFQANNNLPLIYKTLAGSFDYSYKEKYLLQAVASYGSLNRYRKGSRGGFFSSIGLGWNIGKEGFVKDNLSWISNLKLRTTYGKTGNTEQLNTASPASSLYFGYNQYYGGGNGYVFGNSATTATGNAEGILANPFLTWEKADKFNAGLDIGLLNNSLSFSFDYYNNKFYDLLQVRGNNTTLLGNTYPLENIGVTRFTGFELETSYRDNVGKLNYFVSLNATSARNRIEYQDEEFRQYDYMRRTGLSNNQFFGYIADGFFQSAADVAASPKVQGFNPQPGDLKFKDLNGDNVINQFDITALRPDKPLVFFGFNFGISYKGFDLNALLQGTQNRTIYLNNASTEYEFQNGGLGQAYIQHLGRWTPATAATATYPRLTIGGNPNTQAASSFLLKDGDYIRLKNAELGYTLSKKLSNKIGLTSARVFVNGYNLLTSAAFDRVDPETSISGYPAQRVINAGINIKL